MSPSFPSNTGPSTVCTVSSPLNVRSEEASLASVAEVEVEVDFNSGSYLLKYAEYIRGRYIVQVGGY